MAEEEPKLSMGALFARFSTQISDLFRAEIALTKAQAKESGKRFGLAGAMFAGAAVFALFMLGWLIQAMYFGWLGLVGANWAAALLTAAVLFVIVAILALVGLVSAKQAKNHIPEPQKHIQKDVATLKAAVKSGKEGAQK